MVEGTTAADWGDLLALDDGARVGELTRRMKALVADTEDARRAALRDFVTWAFSLPDNGVQEMTEARMRAFLALDEPSLQSVATSFDKVLDSMPAAIAMRRVTIVQHVAPHFTPEERERLQVLEPGMKIATPSTIFTRNENNGGHAHEATPPHAGRAFWRGHQ